VLTENTSNTGSVYIDIKPLENISGNMCNSIRTDIAESVILTNLLTYLLTYSMEQSPS